MLSLAKDIPRLDTRIRQGFWDKAQYRGVELFRRSLGLIGFGRIGRRVYELTVPLQMRVVVYDPFLGDRTLPPGVTRLTNLEELLSIADIVSLHCPLTEKTRNLIGTDELGRMKKTAWLINTARGGVVDEEALIAALQEGKIAGAGLDTFRQEPPEGLRRLCEAGKVVLTPHIAAATEEAFTRMGVEAAQNVLTVLQRRKPDGDRIVNPEVLPQLE
jgi:D-3-phosphoglycerate dehydrogenase